MRVWTLLCLLLALLGLSAEAKRFDPFMVDPLMRRSPLDKNFMRFGRSLPSFTNPNHDSLPKDWTAGDEKIELLETPVNRRPLPRFGRGKQDSFIRLGRSRNDNFMRFGKSRQDNFMRFGRGKQDNFMRFGRGKPDNFMRFGRGKPDNFMRFGRGKPDNFMRFGRGKPDNFMRFGRGFEDQNFFPTPKGQGLETGLFRDSRDKQGNFMRFGRSFVESADNGIPRAMRGILDVPIRDSRAKQDNFMRFGKSDHQELLPTLEGFDDTTINAGSLHDYKSPPSKRVSLVQAEQQTPSKDESFIRFGRNSQDETKESSGENELIPQRLKRSTTDFYTSIENVYPQKIRENNELLLEPLSSLSDYLEEEISPPEQVEDYNNRRKRSLSPKIPTSPPPIGSTLDFNVHAKRINVALGRPEFQTSLISAGLPNVIVGPEFSLLPDLDPPSAMRSGKRPSDRNFLRLG